MRDRNGTKQAVPEKGLETVVSGFFEVDLLWYFFDYSSPLK